MLQEQFQPNFKDEHETLVFRKDVNRCLAILGLHTLPELQQLKKTYKQLVKQWHPDRFYNRAEMETLAVRKTQQINLAYRHLLNVLRLQQSRGPNGSSSSNGNKHNYTWQKYSDGFPDASVDEFFLNSSHIVSAGYHKQRKILYLKFLGDEIYLYFDVPGFIFEHLLQAASSGKYAIKFIYNRFRHRKFTTNFRYNSGEI